MAHPASHRGRPAVPTSRPGAAAEPLARQFLYEGRLAEMGTTVPGVEGHDLTERLIPHRPYLGLIFARTVRRMPGEMRAVVRHAAEVSLRHAAEPGEILGQHGVGVREDVVHAERAGHGVRLVEADAEGHPESRKAGPLAPGIAIPNLGEVAHPRLDRPVLTGRVGQRRKPRGVWPGGNGNGHSARRRSVASEWRPALTVVHWCASSAIAFTPLLCGIRRVRGRLTVACAPVGWRGASSARGTASLPPTRRS